MRHLYLDHQLGDDANDGLSKETAKRTQEAVFAMIESGDTVHNDFMSAPVIVSPQWKNVTFTSSEMRTPSTEELLEWRANRK